MVLWSAAAAAAVVAASSGWLMGAGQRGAAGLWLWCAAGGAVLIGWLQGGDCNEATIWVAASCSGLL
jgi:hypothetical protein